MPNRFLDTINTMRSDEPLDMDAARRIIGQLTEDMGKRILGQEHMIRRVVAAAVLGKHVLIEGMPGEAKTTCVSEFAARVGLRFRRVQFVPDMLPGDLIGSRQLELDKKTGQPDLIFKDGPLCATVVVADEINRAPSKVQAAMLEVMAEKQITRIDKDESHTPYHPEDRAELAELRKKHPMCFGVPLPDPDDRNRVTQVVFATQNPVEQEGTYPLSEASTDRFTFKVLVQPPSILHYTSIAKVNIYRQSQAPRPAVVEKAPAPRQPAVAQATAPAPSPAGVPSPGAPASAEASSPVATKPAAASAAQPAAGGPGNGQGSPTAQPEKPEAWTDPIPVWLKTVSFFQGIRDKLFASRDSMMQHVLDKKPGLWDRVRLVIMLTHYVNADGDLTLTADDSELPDSLRGHHQDELRKLLAEWNRVGEPNSDAIRRQIDALITKSMFEYVERGSSPRGLIDWLQAAVADAFIEGSQVVSRRHFRGVAVDVLRHRISLSAQAAANRIGSPDFITMLVQNLLADSENEEAEDSYPLLNIAV